MSIRARILVIRFSSIGDLVLTTPVIRALHEQLEGGGEVHVLTKKKFAAVLDGNPHIAKVHVIDESVQEVLPELEKIDFDYVIDLHNNIRSRIVKRRLKCLNFTFKKYNFEKWLWVNFGINRMPQVHIVQRYMDTLKAFSVKDDGKGLDYFIPQEIRNQPIDTGSAPYAAFAIGAAHIGKRMSLEKLQSVIQEIDHPIVIIGGPEDEKNGEALAQLFPERVKNLAGRCSLHQSADVVSRAHVVIAGDTGMMHIASAFGKKIILLWGCTVPGLGMYPYRPHPDSIQLEPTGRTKRPCSKLGNRCKYGEDHRCIEQLEPLTISQAVEQLWRD